MISIDYDTAVAMVKQIYPAAKDPMLNIELELTKGSLRFRPYLVAAKFMLTEYRQIVRADEVTFQYDLEKTIRGLLNRQAELDAGDTTIPEGQSVADILTELCNTCVDVGSNQLGVQIF